MTVFVTGATGVLGRPVVRMLRNTGHAVRALSRSASNDELLTSLGAEPISSDLFDVDAMAEAMDGCEAVLHLATSIPAAADIKKPDAWTANDRIRRDGTKAIVDAALRSDSIRSVLYPGVSFFYGDNGSDWLDASNAIPEPRGPLKSTLDAEAEIARFDASAEDRRGLVLRFGAFYGPESEASRDAVAMARRGFALQMAAPSAFRSMIWIDDAATAVVAALARAPSGTYDVVEDEPLTQAEAAKALARAVGRNRLMTVPRWLLRFALPGDLRDLMARSHRISNTRFRDATGWWPAVRNQREGWRRMVAEDPRIIENRARAA